LEVIFWAGAMDLAVPHEYQMIRDTIAGYIRDHLLPLEAQIEQNDGLEHDVMLGLRRRAIELGLYAYNMPAELGGPGLSAFAQAQISEEIGAVCVGLGEALGHLPGTLRFSSARQRETLIPALLAAEKTITYALTEPDAGSDLNVLRTRASRTSGGWMLQGRKQFISYAESSDYIIVLAVSDPKAALKGRLTTFLVARNNPGLRDMTRLKKMGWRGHHLNAFALDDCFVPDEDVLGDVGDGFRSMMATINNERLNVACRCVGLAQRAHDMAKTYAQQRVTFGSRLADHQAIMFMIADSETEIEAARMLTYKAAYLADAGNIEFRIAASRAKLYASEMVGRVADRALQVFGGAGYTSDLPIERFYRDARGFRLGEGTSEIQRIQIARFALSPPM
jgi:alkylation response protein AidB-like acyl-CoA dehydrogenase